eukprot:1928112-Amphidinium_carterae.1
MEAAACRLCATAQGGRWEESLVSDVIVKAPVRDDMPQFRVPVWPPAPQGGPCHVKSGCLGKQDEL